MKINIEFIYSDKYLSFSKKRSITLGDHKNFHTGSTILIHYWYLYTVILFHNNRNKMIYEKRRVVLQVFMKQEIIFCIIKI